MLCGKVCIINLTLRLEVSKHFVKFCLCLEQCTTVSETPTIRISMACLLCRLFRNKAKNKNKIKQNIDITRVTDLWKIGWGGHFVCVFIFGLHILYEINELDIQSQRNHKMTNLTVAMILIAILYVINYNFDVCI